MHSPRRALLTALALLAPLALAVPTAGTAAAAVPATVVVNEVESQNGTPGDWIELANTGTSTVDLAGAVVRDNDDTRGYVLPAGASIPAGGFYVVEEAALGFGLGGADSARLFDTDGTTLVSSYTWTTHAATTYGRCPSGTGAFTTTSSPTKGAANDCSSALRINEVESDGGTPGDWIELVNTGTAALDASGVVVKDDDDTRTAAVPAGTVIPAGGFFVVEAPTLSFGLGGADAARIFAPGGTTLIDGYSWTAHATTTYGRCPGPSGAFTTTAAPTKGAANSCGTTAPTAVVLNEVESSGGTPGDWAELANPGTAAVDVSGFVIKDDDDTHVFTIPAGTTIAAGGVAAFDTETAYGFGAADSVRLYAADGTTLVDSYSWTAHATTTYGRCPSGTGAVTTTTTPTKGAANDCGAVTPPVVPAPVTPWPGGPDVTTADPADLLGGNMSGLAYEASGTAAPGVLWAVKNGPSTLYRLLWDGAQWLPDTANGWSAGKTLNYPDGSGDPDTEGITLVGGSSAGGVFVSTERNNDASGVSRPEVLRFDVTGSTTALNAADEWNLTADLPAVAPNSGLEAVTWVPDDVLVAGGFRDQATGAAYSPATYPDHAGGIFFTGLEANGSVYAYALDQTTGAATRVATFASGFVGVMELTYEPETQLLWAVCDDTCGGRTATLDVDGTGAFAVTATYERPTGMPNLNNEGFTITPQAECVDGRKPVFWADDANTGGHALRAGTLRCTVLPAGSGGGTTTPPPTTAPTTPGTTTPITATPVAVGGAGAAGGTGSGLATTGVELAGQVLLGLAVLTVGGGLVVLGRRRTGR